jgi:hypothetical protein
MTVTERIQRIEELRHEGIDWSEMDRAMYGPLPEPPPKKPTWLERAMGKDLSKAVLA